MAHTDTDTDTDTPPAPVNPNDPPVTPSGPTAALQPRNPLHGVKLEQIVTDLADTYGWAGLAERVPVRCFSHDPSVGSSLKFLRKTPWAREKVEGLYLFMLREKRRNQSGHGQPTRQHQNTGP